MLTGSPLTNGYGVRTLSGGIFSAAQIGKDFGVGKLQAVVQERGWVLAAVCVYPFGRGMKSLVIFGVVGYEQGRTARLRMINADWDCSKGMLNGWVAMRWIRINNRP